MKTEGVTVEISEVTVKAEPLLTGHPACPQAHPAVRFDGGCTPVAMRGTGLKWEGGSITAEQVKTKRANLKCIHVGGNKGKGLFPKEKEILQGQWIDVAGGGSGLRDPPPDPHHLRLGSPMRG